MKRWLTVAVVLLGFLAFAGMAQAQDQGGTTSPSSMSDFALWSIISGAALTYVAAFINNVTWPGYARFGTFFGFSLVVAALNAHFTRELDFHNWTRSLLLVVAAGIIFYNLNKGAIKTFETDVGLNKAPQASP